MLSISVLCNEDKLGLGAFFLEEELEVSENNLLATISKLGSEWRVVFEFKPTNYINGSFEGWTNLLHLTIGGDIGRHGDRTPAIFFHPDRGIYICSSVGQDDDYCFQSSPLRPTLGIWTNIEIGQRENGNRLSYYISVAGEEVHSVTNTQPREFADVKVYASDPWYTPQPGYIRNLSIESRLEGERRISC